MLVSREVGFPILEHLLVIILLVFESILEFCELTSHTLELGNVGVTPSLNLSVKRLHELLHFDLLGVISSSQVLVDIVKSRLKFYHSFLVVESWGTRQITMQITMAFLTNY